jgi:hypothetical protein
MVEAIANVKLWRLIGSWGLVRLEESLIPGSAWNQNQISSSEDCSAGLTASANKLQLTEYKRYAHEIKVGICIPCLACCSFPELDEAKSLGRPRLRRSSQCREGIWQPNDLSAIDSSPSQGMNWDIEKVIACPVVTPNWASNFPWELTEDPQMESGLCCGLQLPYVKSILVEQVSSLAVSSLHHKYELKDSDHQTNPRLRLAFQPSELRLGWIM